MSPIRRRVPALAAACGLALLCTVWVGVAQDALSGAWVMESYRGGGNIGPATGQLIAAEGRFALIYRMTPQGAPPSGRAHAGTYTLTGSALVLHVEWSMDHVSGKGSVADKTSDRRVEAEVRGNQLTFAFENGAVMTFKRARQ